MSEMQAEAAVTPDPELPEPEPEVITVALCNARTIRGRAHWPGDHVTLDAEQARDLIREGLATRA